MAKQTITIVIESEMDGGGEASLQMTFSPEVTPESEMNPALLLALDMLERVKSNLSEE